MTTTAVNVSLHQRDFELGYFVRDFWHERSHPSTRGLHDSPLEIAPIVALYLLFVWIIGPWFMRDRKPYDLKRIMSVYNYINIVVNFVLFSGCLYYTRFSYECWLCQESSAPPRLVLLGTFPSPRPPCPDLAVSSSSRAASPVVSLPDHDKLIQ